MKRCSGKEISIELTRKQNFVQNGVSCKSAVVDTPIQNINSSCLPV